MEKSILLVDDEEGIRKVLKIALSDMGYRVRSAENGVEALRIFKDERPPIVMTDIKMPEMDGIELLRRLKKVSPDTEVGGCLKCGECILRFCSRAATMREKWGDR